MALEKQTVSYNFTKGVDTKTDEYQVSGKLTTLENGVFQTTGAVRKRNGYAEIGANSLTSGNAIAGFNDEIVSFDGSDVYSYSDDQDNFTIKGHKVAVDISQNAIIKNNYAQTYADSAYHANGLKFFTWKDSSGTNQFNYSIVDEATGNNIVANKILVSGATAVSSKVVGNYFVFIYIDQATSYIKYIAIPIATPSTPAAAVTLANDFSGENRTATTTMLNRIYLAYTDASNNIKICYLDSSLVKSAVQTLTVTCEADLALGADNVLSQIWVGYSDYTANVSYLVRNAALSGSILGATLVTNSFQTDNLTIAANNGSGRIYYQSVASYTTPVQTVYYIWSATITNAGIVGTSAQFLRDVAIYSNAFYYNSDFYLGVLHQSDQQSTYFLLNSAGSAVAKIVPNLGGEVVSNWITSINQLSADKFNIAIIERDLVTSEGGQLKFDVGVQETILNFSTPIMTQFLGNNLHASGGILTMYDGVNVCEHGFNLYPENIGSKILPYGGVLPDTGTGSFQYAVTYDWTDNQGQLHQSAPSVPITIETANTIIVVGNTTLGSPTLTGLTYKETTLAPGMAITGPDIPAGTYIVWVTFGGGATITMSQNATGSSTGVSFYLTSQDVKRMKTVANSSTVTLYPDTSSLTSVLSDNYYWRIVNGTSGSSTLTVEDASLLRVGYYFFGLTYRITNIVSNTITLNSPLTTTYTDQSAFFSNRIDGTGSIGNQYFIATTAAQAGYFKVNDYIFNSLSGWPNNITKVTGVNATTGRVDFADALTGNITTISQSFDVGYYFKVGNTISGTGFIGDVNITAVDPLTNSITVDNRASVSATNNFTIKNIVSSKLNLPTLRITDKITNPLVISVWRTPLNETTFYRVTSVQNPVYNDTSVDYISFIDEVDDATLIGNDLLYTTGGVLENIEVPSVKLLTSYRSRLIAVPSESPYSFWYSKQVVPGTPVQFTDAFVSNIDQKGGPITGIVAQDDKLILFKQSLIYYMVGDGPSSTGINNDFTQPQLISSDSGCINKKSIVITPIGTMYQSAKGIYLLSRALEVQFIGADVAGYNSYTVTSAQLVSNFNQVRFTLNTGITLMYDYYYQQWSVFTNYDAIDAAVVGASATTGTYYMIKTDGTVNKETNGQYLDNGSYISLKVVTNWLNFAGLQGYERFYKVLVLGHYKSPHTLNFKSYFDFNETAFQETSITVDSDPTVYQYRIFLSRQKCEAVKFELQDSEITPVGEGFYLSAIAFEVGIKRGLNKMPASVSYG